MKLAVCTGLPDTLLAGLSGGADSVALLRLLLTLPGKRISAVHVNHGLRGADADEDERFCAELCGRLHVPLTVKRLHLPPGTGEGPAREARYAAFREAMAQTGCEALALAHHRDDQTETVLTHLLRGAGLQGLSGMAPDTAVYGMRVVRPLLACTREELRAWLREIGQPWREDATNAETDCLRNRVRHELLPAMRDMAPGVDARIAAAASVLRDDLQALEEMTRAFLREHAGADWLLADALRTLPTGLRRRVLRAWWARAAADRVDERTLSAEKTEELLRTAMGGPEGWCNLPGGLRAYLGRRCLHLLDDRPPPEMPEMPVGPGAALSGCTLTRGAPEHPDDKLTLTVPLSLLPALTLRTARSGDTILPPGSGHRRPLEDYLRQRRVDRPFRARIPLICLGHTVLHAAGLGCGEAEGSAVGGEETVTFTWEGVMPWTL